MPTKLPRVTSNLPEPLHKALLKRAKKEKLSLSKLISMLLQASLMLLAAVRCYSYDNPSEWTEWAQFSVQEKRSVGRTYIWKEQERRDLFVTACLKTYDEPGRSYNDQWHQEIEKKAIACAYRLLNSLDALDKSRAEGGTHENSVSSR